MKKAVYLFCLTLLSGTLFGHGPLRPAELVQFHKDKGLRAAPVEGLFSVQSASLRNTPQISAEVTEGLLLNFNQAQAREIMDARPEFISLTLPFDDQTTVEVELVEVDIFTPDFNITNSENLEIDWKLGTYYRGVIKDMPGSIASVSFIDGEVVGFFSGPRIGNYVLGALQNNNPARTHIMYNDANLVQHNPFECETEDDDNQYSDEELNGVPNTRALSDCIRIFYEIDYDIYQDKGSNTVAFITAEFAEIATIYANENLNYALSEVNVITSSGNAYSNQSSAGMRSQFQSRYQGFNGDLAHMVSYKSSGGIAAGFDGLCNSNPDNSMCFSNIQGNYSAVPTYSWDIMVQTHEMGHLNGSRHTHACVWNGNNTAIDGCAGSTEGSCSNPGYPSNGGTIMSYCHIQSVGINFSNGFGSQPGNVIRTETTNANCLSACGGGGGGGGGNDPCTAQVSSFPYSEGFENTLGQWTQGSGDDMNWTLRSGGTPSSGTGPSSASQGSYYIYMETSSPNYPTKDAYLVSPCFNLASASQADVTFRYHANGSAVGTMRLQASTDDGSSWTTVWSESGSQGTAWTTQSVNIASYIGGTVRLRFFGTSGSSWQGDMCIDDFELSTSGGGGGGGGCSTIDFNSYTINSYGGSQDNGTGSVYGTGEGVFLSGNSWKSISYGYTVTPNTVIEFDFGSTSQGEIHGIGFDSDNSISSNLTIQLYGTQNWGNRNYDYTNPGSWQSFTVPLGSIYTGTFDRLFFVCDKDAGTTNNNTYFRNIKIYEGSCNLPSALAAGPEPIETHFSEYKLEVYPSPVAGQMSTRLEAPEGDYQATLFDLSGRMIWNATIPTYETSHDVSALPAGIYMMKVVVGDGETLMQKVVKAQ